MFVSTLLNHKMTNGTFYGLVDLMDVHFNPPFGTRVHLALEMSKTIVLFVHLKFLKTSTTGFTVIVKQPKASSQKTSTNINAKV